MRVAWLVHWKIQKSLCSTKLTFINSWFFRLVVFWLKTRLTNSLIFWDVAVLMISHMTFWAESKGVVQLMEITETSSTSSFQHPPRFFPCLFKFPFSNILLKLFLIGNRFSINKPRHMFINIQLFEMIIIINLLIIECLFEILPD